MIFTAKRCAVFCRFLIFVVQPTLWTLVQNFVSHTLIVRVIVSTQTKKFAY